MSIQFFDEPIGRSSAREDVRIKEMGLYVYEDLRRIAIGFSITPFIERPSIRVVVTNENGQEAASLSVIEADQSNFNLTIHLRDPEPTNYYVISAQLYHQSTSEGPIIVDEISKKIDATTPGEK